MKARLLPPLLAAAAVCVSGCQTYQYRIAQPATAAPLVAKQAVVMRYDPLEYYLARHHERLVIRITNPTEDRVVLLGDRSYLVDPQGESRPLRGLVLGARSHAWMALPPVPMSYPAYAGWGPHWGWGPYWGWGGGWAGPYCGDPFYWPAPACYDVITPYDWAWKTGLVRLHLVYERRDKTFEHGFDLIREQERR